MFDLDQGCLAVVYILYLNIFQFPSIVGAWVGLRLLAPSLS